MEKRKKDTEWLKISLLVLLVAVSVSAVILCVHFLKSEQKQTEEEGKIRVEERTMITKESALAKEDDKKETGTSDSSGNQDAWYDVEEVSTEADMLEPEEANMHGDAFAEQDPAYTFKPIYRMLKDDLVTVCVKSSAAIPYQPNGRWYGKGFTAPKGVYEATDDIKGLDSLGYVIWVYCQISGKVLPEVKNPLEYYQEHPERRVEDIKKLQVGDIGMVSNEDGKNGYGIYVGLYNGFPVFASCTNVPTSMHATGSSGIAYLASENDSYLNGNHSLDFKYFVRPDVKWRG